MTMHDKTNTNGHAAMNGRSTSRIHPLDAFAAATPSRIPVAKPIPTLRLDDTTRLGIRCRVNKPTIFLGLGTTSSSIVRMIMNLARRELERLPKSVQFLMIDGATPQEDGDKPYHLAIDVDGAGTVAAEGRKIFRSHYEAVMHSLIQAVLGLTANDALAPADVEPITAMNAVVFVGVGGSSSGFCDEAISALRDVARRRGLAHLDTHIVQLSPDMTLTDVGRSMSADQRLIIPGNFAGCFSKLIYDHGTQTAILTNPPGEPSFLVPGHERVASVSVYDNANARHQFAVTSDQVAMIARSWFLSVFTQGGKADAERLRDLNRTGTTGHGISYPSR